MEVDSIYNKCEGMIRTAALKRGVQINQDKIADFANTCRILDEIAEDGDMLRFTSKIVNDKGDIQIMLDVYDLTIHTSDSLFPMLLLSAKQLSLEGIPTSGVDADIPESLRINVIVNGVWD